LLLLVVAHDLIQRRHAILRNFPIIGHFRYLLEAIGPELRQYIVTSNDEELPFNRDQRRWVYASSKKQDNYFGFGTDSDLEHSSNYLIIKHTAFPIRSPSQNDPDYDPLHTIPVAKILGGYRNRRRAFRPPSIINVSAMSFGSLSGNAIHALNSGSCLAGCLHNTGEGGVSTYHLQGGDLIWQIGTGYFGCRRDDGSFDPDMFREQAREDSVKMIEIKVSQGAKPGHGGILPGAKVSAEIAEARRVPVGEDCISPPGHSAYSTPIELLEFVTKLRELSGGKPVGFKLCVGSQLEFFAICRAMHETALLPDFITVDGAEGGTGAAPQEFSDHMGMPLRDALHFVHDALVGVGLRDKLRIAASGKRTSATQLAIASALGADWCNTARGFMFAVGCIQAQSCHTNRCPVGVTTQDQRLQQALVVEEKSKRVYQFHRNTMRSLADFTAAAGLRHPGEFTPDKIWQRSKPSEIRRFSQLYEFMEPGQLLEGQPPDTLARSWEASRADSFSPR
jgi:glutamate synthase domain-containing protein 2